MSNHNLPRRPVTWQEHNSELLKSQPGIAGQSKTATDYKQEEDLARISTPQAQYRTPLDRVNGNEFFRRYIGGQLDLAYACEKVVWALARAKDGGGINQLNTEEQTALGILFPAQFPVMDSGMVGAVAAVHNRLSPMEMQAIRQGVAAKLQEIMNYNAGRGGGSAPGRSYTRS